ncbi:hypothetical protein E4U09_005309 [Claviceps aff. purpurea]|uniref:DUF3984 domain-containing protein n=1 Tax=Claviceps aff. purpurea TaxID=1967640 RepID=A0A9P7QEM8_9HYPO|nr:hypothetical protein E4U09_005309 [Claviceps aff. purpurea]
MDVAYNRHSDRERRKNRSTTNLNHLSLAPLTVKLPIDDSDVLPDPAAMVSHSHITYLQGKSAPATPRLLSRGSATPRSQSQHRTSSIPGGPLYKSQSSTVLSATGTGHSHAKKSKSGISTPRRREAFGNGNEHNDSDWLLRAGALLTSEAREYKGQAWLLSRQSSTSLAGVRDLEEEAFERELARERHVASHRASRRGSSVMADDDASPPNGSRLHSRKHSTADSRSYLGTPMEYSGVYGGDSYFPSHDDVGAVGPDFVNLDERLEELEADTTQYDEATVRRLVRRGTAGKGSWISNVIGWSLFKVEENEDESEDDDDDDDGAGQEDGMEEDELALTGRRVGSQRHFEHVLHEPVERVPPPASDEGGWKDAAWLLSVASKVMF